MRIVANIAVTLFTLIIGITEVAESEKDKVNGYDEFQVNHRPRLKQYHDEHDRRHSATCTHRGILRISFVLLIRRKRREEDRHDVEHHKFGGRKNAPLNFPAEEKQREHIKKKVTGVGVYEGVTDEPVQLRLVLLHLVGYQCEPVETLPIGKTKQGESDGQCDYS